MTMGYVSKTDAELRKLASDTYHGLVFSDRHIKKGDAKNILTSIFLVLAFMEDSAKKELINLPLGLIYEYRSEALPMGINGYPMFMSAKFLNEEDLGRMIKFLEQYKLLQEMFIGTIPDK